MPTYTLPEQRRARCNLVPRNAAGKVITAPGTQAVDLRGHKITLELGTDSYPAQHVELRALDGTLIVAAGDHAKPLPLEGNQFAEFYVVSRTVTKPGQMTIRARFEAGPFVKEVITVERNINVIDTVQEPQPEPEPDDEHTIASVMVGVARAEQIPDGWIK